MPREKEDYRENLVRLSERFNDQEAITLTEAAKVVGFSYNRMVQAVKKGQFPAKKLGKRYVVSISNLARWLS